MEAGSNFVGDVGESGVGKECFAVEAKSDAQNTPTKRGGRALAFESRRLNEESSTKVIALGERLLSEGCDRE